MLCRLVYGADNDMEREVRISCPDATGLGCDVTRMLLDFGLRIVHGDMSTDGKWCFLIFRVSSRFVIMYKSIHPSPSLVACVLPLWFYITKVHLNTADALLLRDVRSASQTAPCQAVFTSIIHPACSVKGCEPFLG